MSDNNMKYEKPQVNYSSLDLENATCYLQSSLEIDQHESYWGGDLNADGEDEW